MHPFFRELLGLNSRAKPYIFWPFVAPWNESANEMRPLSKQQPIEIRGSLDQRPQTSAQWAKTRLPFEHVRHRRAEHSCPHAGLLGGLIPTKRVLPMRLTEQSSIGFCTPDGVTGSLRPSLGVAMVTRRRNLRATPPRIERVLCPLNLGILSHFRKVLYLITVQFRYSGSERSVAGNGGRPGT